MHGFGIMGSSKSIPRVFGVHKAVLSGVFQGVRLVIISPCDFEYIKVKYCLCGDNILQ